MPVHMSNMGICKGVNGHNTVLRFCYHWIIFTILNPFSQLHSVSRLSQVGVRVQKKANVCISPEFYCEALIPYVHDLLSPTSV